MASTLTATPDPVLVVEDNPETRRALQAILGMRGYPVVTADDGAEALEYLQSGKRASVILLDLRMPVMDGWMALRELQNDADLAGVPVIVFSAYAPDDVPGAVATVRKGSFDPGLLLRMIDHFAHRG